MCSNRRWKQETGFLETVSDFLLLQGDIEMQERCLYLPSKFQGPGFQGEPNSQLDDLYATPLPEQPEGGLADTLAPTEEGVYLKRQRLVVFVRKFPG